MAATAIARVLLLYTVNPAERTGIVDRDVLAETSSLPAHPHELI
jgi:hypothetical protein